MKTLNNLDNCLEHLEMAIKLQQVGTIRDKEQKQTGLKLSKAENNKLFNSLMYARDHLTRATQNIQQL